jgi:cell division protein FtsN
MSERELREIQLSAKQVVFLFISAVVVAVVIFLFGVAVGRGVPGTDAPVSASTATDTETVVPVDPPAQPAQELGYHDLLAGPGGTSAPPPTPVPETAPPPAPPADPQPQTPQTAPENTGDWFLQVGAFLGRPAADGLVANLKKLDVPAFVLVPAAGAPDRLFRVRVGPYGTQAEADTVRARLVREGYAPRVTR